MELEETSGRIKKKKKEEEEEEIGIVKLLTLGTHTQPLAKLQKRDGDDVDIG